MKTPRGASICRVLLTGWSTIVWLAWPSMATARTSVNHWRAIGPSTPTLSALAVHRDASGQSRAGAVYAATDDGGLFLSEDSGRTWRRTQLSDTLLVHSLAIHPDDPAIVLAGTHDGIWMTTDWGRHWMRASHFIDGIYEIAFDPRSPDRVFAASGQRGIYRSTDGGATFTPTDLPRPTLDALAIDASDHGALLAGSLAGLYRSEDDGASWQRVAPFAVTTLAADPDAPGTLYAGTFNEGFYVSTDGGATWSDRSAGFPVTLATSIALDPDSSTIYVGTDYQGVWKSDDGGRSWSFVFGDGLARRVYSLAFDPAVSALYVGTRLDGLWFTDDGGVTWTTRDRGLPGRPQLHFIAADPTDASTVYAGGDFGRLFRSRDRGVTWTTHPLPFRFPVLDLVIDPLDPSTLYALSGHVFRSTDQGESWSDTGFGGELSLIGLAIDPSTPSTVYALSTQGLWKSTDSARTWTRRSAGLFAEDQIVEDVYRLVIHPKHPSTLYAATWTGIFTSTDAGFSWTRLGTGFPSDPRVRTLVIDPVNPSTLYAGVSFRDTLRDEIWSSADGGATWTPTHLRTFAYEILAVPHAGPAVSTLYAATQQGIFTSYDGGRRWSKLTAGLGEAPLVMDLAFSPDAPSALFAATHEGAAIVDVVAPARVHELRGGRFRVEVEWRDFVGTTGHGQVSVVPSAAPGAVLLRSSDSAVARFFSPDNWEYLVKVLDGRAVNGHFWVFAAAATNVGYTTVVTDTACATRRTYVNLPGRAAPATTDVTAFPSCPVPGPPSCVESEGVLCLGEDRRFHVAIDWNDFLGQTGAARQVVLPAPGRAASDDSGLFHFFTEGNWELLVKVLDGCDRNGHFWVFGAAVTNVEYRLKITDTATGSVKTYVNHLGTSAHAINDIQAFATCHAD